MWDSADFLTIGDICLRSVTAYIWAYDRAQSLGDWLGLSYGGLVEAIIAEVGSSNLTPLFVLFNTLGALS